MARSEVGRTGARFGSRTSRHAPDPEHPHGRPDEPEAPPEQAVQAVQTAAPTADPGDAEPLVGVTGARFGGHSTKRKRRTRRERAADRAAEAAAAPAAGTADPPVPVGPVDSVSVDTAWETTPLPAVTDGPPPRAAFTPVRPYVLTGGRTRVRLELRIETLVSTVPSPVAPRVDSGEKATVLTLCAQPRSVSEVAALASVPLGVARVLIDDLATEGRVTVHGISSAEDGPSMALMDRVLSGLRRL